nr:MAG: hypothetical protein [Arizlama virus]
MNVSTHGSRRLKRTKTLHRRLPSYSKSIARPTTPRAGSSTAPPRKQAHHPGDTPPPTEDVDELNKWNSQWNDRTEPDTDDWPSPEAYSDAEHIELPQTYHSVWKAARVHFGFEDDETEPEELDDDDMDMVDRYLDWEEETLAAKPWSDPNEAINWKKKEAKGLMKEVKFF